MISYIEKLREKPEYVRRRILYVTAPALTLLVILIWFFSVGSVRPGALMKEDADALWEGIRGKFRVFLTGIRGK